MTTLASWLIVAGVLMAGICIGVLAAMWYIGGEVYDEAPPLDDELEE